MKHTCGNCEYALNNWSLEPIGDGSGFVVVCKKGTHPLDKAANCRYWKKRGRPVIKIETELEKELAFSLMDCLNQSIGKRDPRGKHNYIDASGYCLSAYEDAMGLLDQMGLIDPPRKRGELGRVCKLRWDKLEGV
jgi:hypothetical protein